LTKPTLADGLDDLVSRDSQGERRNFERRAGARRRRLDHELLTIAASDPHLASPAR
jgi:hypothetical protein